MAHLRLLRTVGGQQSRSPGPQPPSQGPSTTQVNGAAVNHRSRSLFSLPIPLEKVSRSHLLVPRPEGVPSTSCWSPRHPQDTAASGERDTGSSPLLDSNLQPLLPWLPIHPHCRQVGPRSRRGPAEC